MTAAYDHLFKVLILGDSGVGKSSILLRFTDDEFDEDISCTIGVDFKNKLIKAEGKKVQLSIWDTAGQEKFRSLTSSYYRGTQGIIFTYDVSNRESFESVEVWMNEAQLYSTYDDVVYLLVANKVDRDDRVVTTATGEQFAREHGMVFLECSAKTKKNIEQVFDELVLKFLERPGLWAESDASSTTSAGIALSSGAGDSAEPGCGC